MDARRLAVPLAALVIACGCLTGCPIGQNGSGVLRLNFGTGKGARTIQPVVSVSQYAVSLSGPSSIGPITSTSGSLSVDLQPGSWTVAVDGLDSGNAIIAKGGAASVLVTANATTTVNVTLSPLTTGTGTIDVTVTWPSSVPAIDG